MLLIADATTATRKKSRCISKSRRAKPFLATNSMKTPAESPLPKSSERNCAFSVSSRRGRRGPGRGGIPFRRFMGGLHGHIAAHWDHEPARSPSPFNGLRAEPRRETNPSVAGVRGEAVRSTSGSWRGWPSSLTLSLLIFLLFLATATGQDQPPHPLE